MRESKIEDYLVWKVISIGGIARKIQWLCRPSAPDRFIAYRGKVILVELKATGEAPTKAQELEHTELSRAGVSIRVIDSMESVDELVQYLIHGKD